LQILNNPDLSPEEQREKVKNLKLQALKQAGQEKVDIIFLVLKL